jgi:hypothetical protein
MANWTLPVLTSLYSEVLSLLRQRDEDLAVMFDPEYSAPSSQPVGAIRWNQTNARFERWIGGSWQTLHATYAINVAQFGGQLPAYYLNWNNLTNKPASYAQADRLATARTIALSGGVSGSASFDGSQNITISTTLNLTSINGIPIGDVTRSTGAFTTVSTTGNVTISNNNPGVFLDEIDGVSTHRQSYLVRDGNAFQIQTRNSTGGFVSTDYNMPTNASGATSHSWRIGGNERLNLGNNGLVVTGWISVNTSSVSLISRITPATDNSGYLGTISTAYASVVSYAVTNLSDARLKEEIADLTEAERRAAKKIKLRTFRWKETGGKRVGYIAQEVIEAMASEGLCAFEYGLVTGSEETRFGVDMDAINAFRSEAPHG